MSTIVISNGIAGLVLSDSTTGAFCIGLVDAGGNKTYFNAADATTTNTTILFTDTTKLATVLTYTAAASANEMLSITNAGPQTLGPYQLGTKGSGTTYTGLTNTDTADHSYTSTAPTGTNIITSLVFTKVATYVAFSAVVTSAPYMSVFGVNVALILEIVIPVVVVIIIGIVLYFYWGKSKPPTPTQPLGQTMMNPGYGGYPIY